MDQSRSTRRAFLAGVGCCAAGTMLPLHSALAALDPMKLQPTFKPGYKPLENDERGLWQQMERLESDMRASNLVMRDTALNSYINDLGCKISADYCQDTRIYVLRTPYFNASMAPNGMMLIWSGLLLRCRNEAQLASVMGHEIGHYTRQHSLQRHRDVRDKASLMTFLAAPLAIVGGAGASQLGQLIVLSSVFANSREQEREADSIGLLALEKHGYPPEEASRVWQQLIDERDASFKARKRKAPSEDLMFATHPQSADRMEALAAQAKQLIKSDKVYDNGRDRFEAVMKKYRPMLVDDQLKLNDFGGTQYLLDSFDNEGWSGELAYYKGELYRRRGQAGDLSVAIGHYQTAISHEDVPPQAHRALGYSLIKEGNKSAGKEALQRYLTLVPEASDRAMVEFSLQ